METHCPNVLQGSQTNFGWILVVPYLTLFILASETTESKLMQLHTNKIWAICGSGGKKAPNLVQKYAPGGEMKKIGKRHKFAEVCLYSRSREFFTIRTKMALARPILELDLYFFSKWKLRASFALACGVIKVWFQQKKFILFHGN